MENIKDVKIECDWKMKKDGNYYKRPNNEAKKL